MEKLKKILLLIVKIVIFMISLIWIIVFAGMANEAYKNEYFIDMFIYLLMMIMPFIIYFVFKYMNRGKMDKTEIEAMNVKRINAKYQTLNDNAEIYYSKNDEEATQIDIKDKEVDKSMPNLIKCPACGKNVSNQAVACPNCGQPTVNSSVKDIDNNYIDNKKNEIACGKPMSKPIIGSFKHINGLNLPENAQCTVLSYPALYEFQSGSLKFTLLKSKVVDVTIKTDREIQQQYVSSIGGTVGGAVLFGPLGAIIGGRAKKKAIKTYYSYLIITYKDNENLKYIGFDVTNAPFKAQKFVNELKKTNNTITNVDL